MTSSARSRTAAGRSDPGGASRTDRIGRFPVIEVIGKGAQGIVYRARDPNLDREVAIKTLRPSRDRAALEREARIVAGLAHPNVVPVYEVGAHDGLPFVVYEYVPGSSLRGRLQAGEVAVHQAVRWTMEVLDGAGHAHARAIVHRDLNPSNIHIDDRGTARVMDFGVSVSTGTQADATEGVVGTASYLAPEQIAAGVVGPWTDVFSVGLVLYEMLVGEPAIAANDAMAAMFKIAHEPIDPPSRRSSRVDAALDAVVMMALEKAPEGRYTSAEAMREALASWLGAAGGAETDTDDAAEGSALKFIMRRMRRNSDFPAISAHVTEIRRKTTIDEVSSVSDVANVILKDYALSTKLLKLVNSSFYGQYGGHISTISRAVVILGFEQVRMAALSLLLFEHLDDGRKAGDLKEAAGEAFLAGVIGRNLAGKLKRGEPEEVFVCSMMVVLGRYLTIYYLSEEYAEIRKAVEIKGLDEESAARAVLGVTYAELGAAVAREWQLPSEVIDCMRPLADGTVAPATSAQQHLHRLSAYSNELGAVITNSAPEEREKALAALRQRYEKAVPVTPKMVTELIEAALEDVREYAQTVGTDFGKTRAVGQAERFLGAGEPAPEGAGDTAPADAAPGPDPAEESPEARAQRDERHTVLMNGIQDITNALLENCALNDILVMVLETIYRGFGFSRVLFCIADPRNRRMVGRFGLGQDIDAVRDRFRFGWQDGNDAFAAAVQNKRDLVFPSQHCPPSLLPEWFRESVSPAAFIALPIVVREICVGMIYCDYEQAGKTLPSEHLNFLNTLRKQAALAVKQRRG